MILDIAPAMLAGVPNTTLHVNRKHFLSAGKEAANFLDSHTFREVSKLNTAVNQSTWICITGCLLFHENVLSQIKDLAPVC